MFVLWTCNLFLIMMNITERFWTFRGFPWHYGIGISSSKSQTGGCIEWHRWICYTGCYLLRTSMIYNIMRWFQREMRTRLQFFLFRYGHHGNPSDNLQLAKRHFGLYSGKLIVGLAILVKSEILWTHPCGLVDWYWQFWTHFFAIFLCLYLFLSDFSRRVHLY